MMKKTIVSVATLCVLTTGLMAAGGDKSVNIGASSISIDSQSGAGVTFGTDVVLFGSEKVDMIGLISGSTHKDGGFYGDVGFGVRYNINNMFSVGALGEIAWYSYSISNSNNPSLIGFAYSGEARYHYNKHHGALLSYTVGSLSDSTGLVTIDSSAAKLSYVYNF